MGTRISKLIARESTYSAGAIAGTLAGSLDLLMSPAVNLSLSMPLGSNLKMNMQQKLRAVGEKLLMDLIMVLV
jgi:hypothetical protein